MIPDLRILRDARLTQFQGTTRWVLLAIAGRINANGSAWPTVTRIAAEAGVSERTVQRSVDELIAAGALTVEGREGGRERGATYQINPDTLAVFAGDKPRQADRVKAPKPRQPVTKTPPTCRVKGDRLAPEGYKKDNREGGEAAPSFLQRLTDGGAVMKSKGTDLGPEWERLPDELGISEDEVIARLNRTPPPKFPSAIRSAVRTSMNEPTTNADERPSTDAIAAAMELETQLAKATE